MSHWIKRGREGGEEALKAHPPKGVSPRLTAEQKAQIPALLAKGAEAYGFRGDVWTASRVAEVIKRTFGVRYHRDHVGKLMREAGWSRQKPVERASQRNEEAIKQWSDERWPEIKKSRSRESDHPLGRRSGLLVSCRWLCVAGLHAGRRQCYASNSRVITSRRSVVLPWMDDCFCKCVPLPMMPKQWWGSCASSYVRSPVRLYSFGMARPFTALTRSRTFSSAGRPNVCIWSNCPAMPLISTRMRASGITSSGWSWGMSVVPISISCIASSFKPKNACGTKRRSSKVALVSAATWFSFLSRGQ